MTSNRIRFNRTVFAAPCTEARLRPLLDELAAEDVELVIDLRPESAADSATVDELCRSRSIHYTWRAGLENDADVAWAARLALRHRTCVIAHPSPGRADVVRPVAELVGMRLIDLQQSPAPISTPGYKLTPGI